MHKADFDSDEGPVKRLLFMQCDITHFELYEGPLIGSLEVQWKESDPTRLSSVRFGFDSQQYRGISIPLYISAPGGGATTSSDPSYRGLSMYDRLGLLHPIAACIQFPSDADDPPLGTFSAYQPHVWVE